MAPNTPVQKERGFRNTFDVSPWFEGRKITSESGCGPELRQKYGEFQRYVTGDGIVGRDPLEINSFNDYQIVDATNSAPDDEWTESGIYLKPGKRSYCVSYNHLAHYKCIDCQMTDRGKVVGCGARYDVEK